MNLYLNLKIKIPDEIEYVLKKLKNSGFEAYIVGGAVRDAVLGRKINDYDITTNALPHDIHQIFDKCIDTGIKHGTVTVISGNTPIEVTTFRIDGKYENHRTPKNVEFSTSLEDDLKRRDFTVNSLAYDNKIIDLFGGLDDIKNKTIKAVLNPEKRFNEDALRMMRAIRFACMLGFKLKSDVKAAITKLSHLISFVSNERIKSEFDKLIMSDFVQNLSEIKNCNLFNYILPNLQTAIDNNTDFSLISSAKNDISIRYTLLFILSKQDNIKEFLNKYKFSNNEKKEILTLFSYSKKDIENNEMQIKSILSKIEKPIFEKVLYIKKTLGNNIDDLSETYKNVRDDPCRIKDLKINGSDLLNLGISGSKIKTSLEYLIFKVMENKELNTKEKLLNEIKLYLKNETS